MGCAASNTAENADTVEGVDASLATTADADADIAALHRRVHGRVVHHSERRPFGNVVKHAGAVCEVGGLTDTASPVYAPRRPAAQVLAPRLSEGH